MSGLKVPESGRTAALFLAAFVVYLTGLAPGLVLEDSGEMLAAAATLGNTHPPGHPLYILSSRLAFLLPAGSPAFRVNVLSAVWMSLSVLAIRRTAAMLLPAGPAAMAAAAAFLFSRTAWWQAGIPEKYSLAVLLFSLALFHILKAEKEERQGRAVARASLLTGLTLCHHLVGLFLLAPLALVLFRARSRRALAVALVAVSIPLGLKALYPPLRAQFLPPVNWGAPDRVGRWVDYAGARLYVSRYFFSETDPSSVALTAIREVFSMPWEELGPVLLLAPLGALWVVRSTGGAAPGVLASVLASNLVLALACPTPEAEKYFLPSYWILALLAGLGTGWLATRWGRKAAVVVAVAAIAVEAWSSAGYARRDNDYTAPDHVRNMLVAVPDSGLVVAWGDPWLLPLLYPAHVAPDARSVIVVPAEALLTGAPGRAGLEKAAGLAPGSLHGYQDGPALLWKVAALRGARGLFLTQGSMAGQVPSRGAKWAGASIRVTGPGEPFGLDGASRRIGRSLRLRSLGRPRGLFETLLASYYAQSMYVQGLLALKEGQPELALSMASLGGYFNPALPEIADLRARSVAALGYSSVAFTWWKRALKITPGGTYLEPYLGLARLADRDRDAEQELEYIRMAALAGGGQRDPGIVAGDEARAAGRRAVARREYRAAAARVLAARGMAYFQNGKLPQAGSSWEDALELDPKMGQVLQNLGSLAALEERFADAVRWYRRALAVVPGSSEVRENIAKACEGAAWLARIPQLEKAADGNPGKAASWVELGNAYWFVGRARSAESTYRRALAIDKGNARAWTNLGSALVNQGRMDEAIAACEAGVEADQKYVEAALNLVAIYQGLGQRGEVERWLKKAWEGSPGDARVAAAMRAAGLAVPAGNGARK